MKLINVENEQAVARVLTCVRILKMYSSLTHSAIREDMSPFDAENMITFKKWYSRTKKGAFHFKIIFHLETKQGWTLWTATCAANLDYFVIKVCDVSFKLTKRTYPKLFDFGVDCEFGFLSFCAVPTKLKTVDLLKGYVDEVDYLFEDLCIARTLAESHSAKIEELNTELDDLKQQLADIYWSTQN